MKRKIKKEIQSSFSSENVRMELGHFDGLPGILKIESEVYHPEQRFEKGNYYLISERTVTLQTYNSIEEAADNFKEIKRRRRRMEKK